jgi:hypothetical protein
MNEDVFEVLINALKTAQQRARDNELMKQIVADSRRSPAHQPSSAMTEIHKQAEQVRPNPSQGGWVDAKRVDDWRPPGIDLIDRMVENQEIEAKRKERR